MGSESEGSRHALGYFYGRSEEVKWEEVLAERSTAAYVAGHEEPASLDAGRQTRYRMDIRREDYCAAQGK